MSEPKLQHDPQSFEAAMQSLASLVERMENNDLPLEEALQLFEQGIQLTRYCQKTLSNAELQVETLLKNSGLDAGSVNLDN